MGDSRRRTWLSLLVALLAFGGFACGEDGWGDREIDSARLVDSTRDVGSARDVGLPLGRHRRPAEPPASTARGDGATEPRPPVATQGRPGRPLTRGSDKTVEGSANTAALSQGRIVYELHRSANAVDLVRLDAGASSPTYVTRGPARDLRPRWSPDGSRIVFFRERDGSGDIWSVSAGGGDPRRLTDDPGHDFDPAWMPDGRRIVFTSRRDGDDNLWLLDLDDGSLLQLTHFDGGRAGAPSPTDDGRTVFFSADRLFSWQIWRLDLETGETERLTGPLPGACNSAWSQATGRFVHMSGGTVIGTDLVSRRPDGSDKTGVGSGRGNNHDPEFSQDGRRLVWVSDRDGNWEVYESGAAGGGERRVTRTPQHEGHPDLYLETSARR